MFYETREQWSANNPDELKWKPAKRRTKSLGGQYVARIPATTAIENSKKIIRGFDVTKSKGAGIRVYEYADAQTTNNCRFQLEALFWSCTDAVDVVVRNGMTKKDAINRKAAILEKCKELELLDIKQLPAASRVLNSHGTYDLSVVS